MARAEAGQVCQACKPQTLTVTSLSMQTSTSASVGLGESELVNGVQSPAQDVQI